MTKCMDLRNNSHFDYVFQAIQELYKVNKWLRLHKKLSLIEVVILDVDGVLTDGTIFIGSDGTEFKRFNVEDGTGAAFARLVSIPIVLISGRESKSTSIRAKELKIEYCFQGSLDKTTPYKEVCKIYNVTPKT